MSAETHIDSDSLVLPPSFKLEQPVKIEDGASLWREPTEKELCEVILMIKDRLPNCRLDTIIKLLNDTLVEKGEKARSSRRSLLDEQDYFSQDEISELQKKRMQQQYARKFENSEANPRFYQERQIAKLFCSKGYGYPTARQYLGDSITPNRYNNVITTIVRLSYRKLQYYITKYIQPRLPVISREQLKMIKTPLVNCRNWMTPQQSQNFHRFVKLTYKIHTQQPQKEHILELHDAIMQQLKKRNVNYRPHRRGHDPNSWSPQMDERLIANYLAYPDIHHLQSHLLALFPNQRTCFQLGRLKLRLERLIRLALRKIYCDRDKFGLNQPSTLSEYLVCKINKKDGALDVRKRLLSYYLDNDTNAMKLRWVKQVLQEYVKASRSQVEEIEDSSCEVVPKQQIKIEPVGTSEHPKDEQVDMNDKKQQYQRSDVNNDSYSSQLSGMERKE